MVADADPFLVVDVNITSVDFSSLMSNKNLCVRTNKSKVNLLQVFCPREKQLVHATQGMSNLKIDRSVTSNRYSSAKSYGRSTLIQGNNVHVNKGKSVAYPLEKLVFSCKEILRKEPPKPIQENSNSEDDTICEKCSQILAKCFANSSKEENS
jgi:hypothetical protein